MATPISPTATAAINTAPQNPTTDPPILSTSV